MYTFYLIIIMKTLKCSWTDFVSKIAGYTLFKCFHNLLISNLKKKSKNVSSGRLHKKGAQKNQEASFFFCTRSMATVYVCFDCRNHTSLSLEHLQNGQNLLYFYSFRQLLEFLLYFFHMDLVLSLLLSK